VPTAPFDLADLARVAIAADPAGAVFGVPVGDAPASWWTYFEVPDADAACRRVGELGGRVLRPPADSPYGRLAAVADDQGATFLVVQG
jgi:predicted enzyme related to lactoylglutathione lyase